MKVTARGGRDLNGCFFGLDLDQILAALDEVAILLKPSADLHLADRFANGRNFDRNDFAHGKRFYLKETGNIEETAARKRLATFASTIPTLTE